VDPRGLVVGTVVGVPMGLLIPMTRCRSGSPVHRAAAGRGARRQAEYLAAIPSTTVRDGRRHLSKSSWRDHVHGRSWRSASCRDPAASDDVPGQNASTACCSGGARHPRDDGRHPQLSSRYALVGVGCSWAPAVLPDRRRRLPVLICLLNSYAGWRASASGFALDNNVLIICGALDGGSGLIPGADHVKP